MEESKSTFSKIKKKFGTQVEKIIQPTAKIIQVSLQNEKLCFQQTLELEKELRDQGYFQIKSLLNEKNEQSKYACYALIKDHLVHWDEQLSKLEYFPVKVIPQQISITTIDAKPLQFQLVICPQNFKENGLTQLSDHIFEFPINEKEIFQVVYYLFVLLQKLKLSYKYFSPLHIYFKMENGRRRYFFSLIEMIVKIKVNTQRQVTEFQPVLYKQLVLQLQTETLLLDHQIDKQIQPLDESNPNPKSIAHFVRVSQLFNNKEEIYAILRKYAGLTPNLIQQIDMKKITNLL